MSTPKCAVCGKRLTWPNWHQVWDGGQKKMVRVCRDDRNCYGKYVRPFEAVFGGR